MRIACLVSLLSCLVSSMGASAQEAKALRKPMVRAIEMGDWPERESGSFANRFRNKATKESAERCLRVIRELFMTTSVL